MKKKYLLVGLVALFLVACGQKDLEGKNSNAPGTNVQETAENASASSNLEPINIKTKITGQEVDWDFSRSPQRVVSLSGFTTEMLLALDLGDHMVGTGYLDNEILPKYKDAYDKIPVLSDTNPSKEVLLEANPDFVIGWSSTFNEKNFPLDFLQANDIKGFVPYSEYAGNTMEDVYKDYRTLGKIFHVESKAEEVVKDIQGTIDQARKSIPEKDPIRVFVYDSGEDAPLTAGGGLATDIISLAGGENIFKDIEKNWFNTQWETVIEKDPEFILVMKYGASDDADGKIAYLKSHPALKDLEAVKNNRILVLGLSDLLPGERPAQAIEKMAKEFYKNK